MVVVLAVCGSRNARSLYNIADYGAKPGGEIDFITHTTHCIIIHHN